MTSLPNIFTVLKTLEIKKRTNKNTKLEKENQEMLPREGESPRRGWYPGEQGTRSAVTGTAAV